MDKKIMILGGNYFQTTIIKAAKDLGCHVISVDYLPSNPGHKFSDEYYNVSTTDRDGILELAKRLKVDGICTYASDVSAPTVAYVAEKMGLPGNPLSSVEILTRKDLTRNFLKQNGFSVPEAKGFTSYDEALKFFQNLNNPVMIKPVDSSGSKGVAKVSRTEDFSVAYDSAMKYSISKKIIVEKFIQRKDYNIGGDGFLSDGNLQCTFFTDGHGSKYCSPFVPTGHTYPSANEKLIKKAKPEIQRLMRCLKMRTGAINWDLILDENDAVYILELGARNGGNLIPDEIKFACGVDLPKYTIMAALGMDCSELKEQPIKNFVSSYIIHSLRDGIFKSLRISDEIKKKIIRRDLFVTPGEKVYRFDNSSLAVGAMLLKFDSVEEMNFCVDNMEDYVECVLDEESSNGFST